MVQPELTTIFLVFLLIAAFVVAFKLMEIVFEVITVSILSGAFYVGLWAMLDYPLTLQRVVLFAFLGASLYILFSLAASVYSVSSSLASVPIAAGSMFVDWIKSVELDLDLPELPDLVRDDDEKVDPDSLGEEQSRGESSSDEVKEVVIDKVSERGEEHDQ